MVTQQTAEGKNEAGFAVSPFFFKWPQEYLDFMSRHDFHR